MRFWTLAFLIVALCAAGCGIDEQLEGASGSAVNLTGRGDTTEPAHTPVPAAAVTRLELSQPPPPVERRLRPHPRLLVTADNLPALRAKLTDPMYADDVVALRGSRNPTDQALVYLLWGDTEALEVARSALLSGKIREWKGLGESIGTVQAALMYDWLYEALGEAERARAAEVVLGHAGNLSSAVPKKYESVPYFWNDLWSRGGAARMVAALALAGDYRSADDALASAYSGSHQVFSPYAGGAIDVLNALSLGSGGGAQVGTQGIAGTGYEGMFLRGAAYFLPSWQSATYEEVLAQTDFFQKYPEYLAYYWEGVDPPGEWALQSLEFLTGWVDGDSADLAVWFIQKYGRAKYGLALRLILGDLTRATARSPEALQLPLAAYLPGSDLLVSRTGWQEEDIVISMFARHWDMARYEPASGALGIYRNGRPLLVRGTLGKTSNDAANSSAMWVWQEGKLSRTLGQGSTYWNDLDNFRGESRRAVNAADVVNPELPAFRPQTLRSLSLTEGEVSATTEYARLLKVRGVSKAERTLRHSGTTLTLIDHLEVPRGTRVAWSLRLPEEPEIIGNRILTGDLEITLQEPTDARIYWSGGVGKELAGPTGQWHGSRKFGYVEGYGKSPEMAARYGLGYVFAEPAREQNAYRFEAVINIKPAPDTH